MKFFSPFIIIAVSIAAYFLYISPSLADVSALNAQKLQYSTALTNAQALKAHRDAIAAQYNAISPADIARLQVVMPQNSDNVAIVTNINAIASQYGMIIHGVKISENQDSSQGRPDPTAPSVPSSLYQTTNITFTTDGSYQQFTAFLRDVESNARLFDVTGVSIKDVSKVPGGGQFEYTIQTQTYSLH